MAYVSVSEWRPEQVTEWLKGVDICVTPYLHWFSNNEVNGQQLLNLSSDELTHLGVHKIGHQELVLEAVEHLRNFHYELDRENLQLLALRVSCAAHSLYNEIKHKPETTSVPTQIMADVSNVINHVKPLASWLDRPPFSGQIEYADYKSKLLRISLEMATCAQRDTFAERPISEIKICSSKLSKLADSIIQDIKDPMLLQPAFLDLATIKKRVGEDLGFFLIPSFHGIHQISDMKLSSPAHQSGKIQPGDEIVQVNYQTVVGWSRKKVLALFDESPNDLLLTLKRRPRHVKMYGQIYMKPYRLPSRKRSSPYSRWNDNVQNPRPELLTLSIIPRIMKSSEKLKKNEDTLSEPCVSSSSSDEEFGQTTDPQNSVTLRLYLPKPRVPIQRRFTLSGPPRPSAQSEQFWRELQLERSWRSNQNNSQINKSNSEKLDKDETNVEEIFHLRDKSASLGNSIATAPVIPVACINFTKNKIGSVKFDLPKVELGSTNPETRDKAISKERDKTYCDSDSKAPSLPSSIEKNSDTSEKGADSKIMSSGNKMSISELNKMKRDAFFSNMDCSSVGARACSNEDSSEKVKRIIENFRSDVSNMKMEASESELVHIPGKVLQLIGSFERKEIGQKLKLKTDTDLISSAMKEKRSLNEVYDASDAILHSHSVKSEAYENMQETNLKDEESDCKEKIDSNVFDSDGSKAVYKSKLNLNKAKDLNKLDGKPKKENHGQMVNTINDYLLPNRDFYCIRDCYNCNEENIRFDEDFELSYGSDSDSKQSNETSEIVDTVHLALVELNQRDDHLDLRIKQKENEINIKNENTSFSSSSSSSSTSSMDKSSETTENIKLNVDLKKPVPAQRKSKMPLEKTDHYAENVHLGPLPPKPRPRMPEKTAELLVAKPAVKNRTPPEPPPRPESTFLKVFNTQKYDSKLNVKENYDVTSVSEIRKGNASVAQNLKITSMSPISQIASCADGSNKNFDVKQMPSPTLPVRDPTKFGSSFRGNSSVLNVSTDKSKSCGSTLENLKAMLSLGRKPLNFNSPRSMRKKNIMLSRKRNVSVKELSPCENCGPLWHRNRKGTAVAPWSKFYFVLQGPNFYGFKSKDSQKADLFIHLPGFTCTIADEVKSKEFAFKIYHTGTAFYFAANSKEDLQQWLDSIILATICPDEKQIPETVTFSVSDSESSDIEVEPETCFPTSPKMKKFLGSSPVPKPARSHQNLASDSKKTYDIQKRFGSLKKLSSQKHSANNQNVSLDESESSPGSEIASLDRKYLRFLGNKSTPLPVPTSQFRSYRRMHPSTSTPMHGKLNEKNEKSCKNVKQSITDQPGLVRKTLHLSNPSLIHPDMADYRVTQERLAEFRKLRNRENTQEINNFMTLEQFMISRQEEASMRTNRSRPPELRGFMTLEQFLLRQEEERQLLNWPNRNRDNGNEFLSDQQNIQGDETTRRQNTVNKTRPYSRSRATSSLNKEKHLQATAFNFEKPQAAIRTTVNIPKHDPHMCASSSASSQCSEGYTYATWDSNFAQSSTRKSNTPKLPLEEESAKVLDCSLTSKDTAASYPGGCQSFEAESTQYVLNNRQKRSANRNKKEDKK